MKRSLPNRRIVVLRITGAITGVFLLAPVAGAQSKAPTTVRVRAAQAAQTANSCLRQTNMPSSLADSREGLAILRMQRELDGVSQRMSMQHVDSANPHSLRRVLVLQKGLDSIAQYYVRTSDGRTYSAQGGSLTEVSGRQLGEVERTMIERQMERQLREIEPRVAAAVRSSEPFSIGRATITINTLGYVGIAATALKGTFPMIADVNKPFAYCEYPFVEAVEPGSPAEKAGLMAGDTLLAYNGRDLLVYDVNFPELLIPDKPLRIKFRRNGQVREVTATVAGRSTQEVHITATRPPCTESEFRAGCGAVMRSAPNPVAAQGGMIRRGVPLPLRMPMMPDGRGGALLLGALLREWDEETARNMGVDAGVFVVAASGNNPAYDAGIRAGDAIITANGVAVRDLNSLDSAIRAKVTERMATLQLSNKMSGTRTVTLRW